MHRMPGLLFIVRESARRRKQRQREQKKFTVSFIQVFSSENLAAEAI